MLNKVGKGSIVLEAYIVLEVHIASLLAEVLNSVVVVSPSGKVKRSAASLYTNIISINININIYNIHIAHLIKIGNYTLRQCKQECYYVAVLNEYQ